MLINAITLINENEISLNFIIQTMPKDINRTCGTHLTYFPNHIQYICVPKLVACFRVMYTV